jgi:hypothetical protein
VKRIVYFATTALLAMLMLAPSGLAQDMVPGDDDPNLPEPDAVVVGQDELHQIAGGPAPETTTSQPLPKTGGPEVVGTSVLLPAAALLLGSGLLSYAVLRRRN